MKEYFVKFIGSIFILLFLFIAIFVGIGGIFYIGSKFIPKVAIVDIDGPIRSGFGGNSMFGSSVCGADEIISTLRKIEKDSTVKAVILRINSPGGTVGAAQEIFSEIHRLRNKGKLVIASGADVMASGAYYIASACDRIFVNPGTLVGSIGVIMSVTDFSKVYKRFQVTEETFKSGKFKDIGSSSRPMTSEEKKIIQDMINKTYKQFLSDVSKSRKINIEKLKKYADGRVYTGLESIRIGLSDQKGTLVDALSYIKKKLGLWKFETVRSINGISFPAFMLGKLGLRFPIVNTQPFSLQYILK